MSHVNHKSYRSMAEKQIADRMYVGMRGLCGSITKKAKFNANRTAPRHPQVDTGNLRRSISFNLKREGRMATTGTVGIMRGVKDGDKALEYARRIELGFMNMTDSRGRRFFQPPYPYLRPAARAHRHKVKEFFK